MFNLGTFHFSDDDNIDDDYNTVSYNNTNISHNEKDKIIKGIEQMNNNNSRLNDNLKLSFKKIEEMNKDMIISKNKIDKKVMKLENKINNLEERLERLEEKVNNNCIIIDE